MANVQKQFAEFHAKIRTDYDMNNDLRKSKDAILESLKRSLKEKGHPPCSEYLQGSYRVGTGICPIADLEYDIDVGLMFCFKDTDHTAAEVRKWVFDAVKNQTNEVKEMGACIRVYYANGYHVDLVSYAYWNDGYGVEQYRFAHRRKGWVAADPPKLLDYIGSAREPFKGTEDSGTKTDQLRRVVRGLKRWNDEAMPFESNDKPSGLALLLWTINHLTPQKDWAGNPIDSQAHKIVSSAAADIVGRISAKKPTPEYEDVFGKISEDGMKQLKQRFNDLYQALVSAEDDPDPVSACKTLRKVFGSDFPIPDLSDTAKKSGSPAVVTSSGSAFGA